MDRVDALVLGQGYVDEVKAAEVAVEVPESPSRILDWLRIARDSRDWRRLERLAAVALHLHPDGLGPILAAVVASRAPGVNMEDLVDMLGELRAVEAVQPIGALLRERKDVDGPFYSFCVKGIQALGEIGTPEAHELLRGIAVGEPQEWPAPLRWHAAEELGIEDELGFNEDQMLGDG